MNRKKPNILFIITDEHRVDSLGCYDSPWGHSPNIDTLAAQGVRFSNCTEQSPVCVPSRTSMITGRYPHACGVLAFESVSLPEEIPLTWLFRDAGYQVANFGKCDYADQERNPFEIHVHGPGYGASAATPFQLEPPYKPADHDVVFAKVPTPWADALIVGGLYPLPKEQAEPGLIASLCEDFLKKEVSAPFFLRVSIIAPHTPVLASRPFFGSTDPEKINIPVITEAEKKSKPRYEENILKSTFNFQQLPCEELSRARANYYDLCTEVDYSIGKILKALNASGHADNTIIVFTSDHGTMLGEHGLCQKHSFYDPVVQVPLVIAYPPDFPKDKVINDPVELIDVMPTLLSMSGLDIPDNVHGKDLIPQITDTLKIPHRPTFSEIDYSRSVLPALRKFGSHRVMCRSHGWKLSYSLEDVGYGEDGSLYDLKRDPFEFINLFNDPGYQDIIKSLKDKIEQW